MTGKYIWSLALGASGIAVAGGYGAMNYFSSFKASQDNLSSGDPNRQHLEVNNPEDTTPLGEESEEKKENISLPSEQFSPSVSEVKEAKNDPLFSAEYIFQGKKVVNNDYEDKRVCTRWIDGKEQEMGEQECDEIIQGKWGEYPEDQPKIWFRASEEDIVDVLWHYFSSESSVDKEMLSRKKWNSNSFTCERSDSSESEGEKKVEVSCNYRSDK